MFYARRVRLNLHDTKTLAYASLGSNSGNAAEMLARAREGIAALPDVAVEAASAIYCTEPQDYAAQPWFQNQVLRLAAGRQWTAPGLLDAFLSLEASLGRVRAGERFGPRCIDMDLLLFGSETWEDEHCRIPHPRMCRRAFVLVPLAELASRLLIHGKTPGEWLALLRWRMDGRQIFQSG